MGGWTVAVALLASVCEAQFFPNSTQTPIITLTSSEWRHPNDTRPTFVPANWTDPGNDSYSYIRTWNTNECQSSFDEWTISYMDYPVTTVGSTTDTISQSIPIAVSSSLIYNCSQTCGTVCYIDQLDTSYSYSYLTNIQTLTQPVWETHFPAPRPTCTIPYEDCLYINEQYTSELKFWSSQGGSYWDLHEEPTTLKPACSACRSTACYINAYEYGVTLYYFPPKTTASRDMCASVPLGSPSSYEPDHNLTYVPITTGPSAVVGSKTMYEGNVYMEFPYLYVYDNCGHTIPRQNTAAEENSWITVPASAVQSVRKWPPLFVPADYVWDLSEVWPVNFDDFREPVPYSAYMGARQCGTPNSVNPECSLVEPGRYHPLIRMPAQIRDLDPAWRDCKYDLWGAIDPPISLNTRPPLFPSTVITQPTSGALVESITQPAPNPGQPGSHGIPSATQVPQSPASPTTTTIRIDRPTRPAVTIGPSTMSIGPSGGLIIAPGITIRPEDPPVRIDDKIINVRSSEIVVVDSEGIKTIPIPRVPAAGEKFVTVGSSIHTLDASGGLVIAPGVTLRIGEAPQTIHGTVYSRGQQGLTISDANGASTIRMPNNKNPFIEDQIVSVGSKTYAIRNGKLIVNPFLTLSASGPAIVVDGTTISMASAGVVVSGPKTSSEAEKNEDSTAESGRTTTAVDEERETISSLPPVKTNAAPRLGTAEFQHFMIGGSLMMGALWVG